MIVRRTIENLRERPHEERTAFAASVALGVVALLFVCWLIYFFHSIAAQSAPAAQSTTSPADQSSVPQAQQQAPASTTQFMDVEGNVETQDIATSSMQAQ